MTMQFPAPSETFAAVEIRAVRALGVEVDVYGLRPEHPRHTEMVRERDLNGVKIEHASAVRVLRGLVDGVMAPTRAWSLLILVLQRVRGFRETLKSLALLPLVLRIDAELRSGRYDGVHLFWGHYPALVGALLQRRGPAVPVSLFLGAYDLSRGYGPSADVAKRAALVWTHAAVNTPALEAIGVAAHDIRVVYRGVDLERIDAVRSRMGSRVAARVVAAGRLIPSKGLDRVLRAFARVRAAHPSSTLVVLGDGPERAALEATAGALGLLNAVRFAGHVAHDDVITALCEADAFVLLSSKPDERLPNVVKEAMACGAVCVVSHTPGIDELVEHERTGYVVDASDEEGAAAHLERVLTGGPDIDGVRARARGHVEACFAASSSAATLVAGWRAAVRGAPA